MGTTQTLDIDDIQGILLRGYGRLGFVRYLFISFDSADGARAWLAQVAKRVSNARREPAGAPKPTTAVNIAFTSVGLKRLGLSDAEMNTFPTPFHVGMTDPYRRRILGDFDEPSGWDFGGPNTAPVHALLLLHADTEARRDELTEEHRAQMAAAEGVVEVHMEEGYRPPDNKEHFGFVDGISQPSIEGSGRPQADSEEPIKAGEFILGYLNEYGEFPTSPTLPSALDPDGHLHLDRADSGRRDLGRNGSFLVFRKIRQDVAGFWRFATEHSKKPDGVPDPDAATYLASRVVGRWPSGAPLVLAPERDDPSLAKENDFTFTKLDPKGHACPIGAHIRRTNPRDALPPDAEESIRESRRHRLLRRSRLYGPRVADQYATVDDGVKRGIHFVILNASIDRQFEFVQQTWVCSPKFGDLYDDPDPLVGVHPYKGARRFTIQGEPVRRAIEDLPHFVEVRGGAYFFLPSLRGLRFLAQGGYTRTIIGTSSTRPHSAESP